MHSTTKTTHRNIGTILPNQYMIALDHILRHRRWSRATYLKACIDRDLDLLGLDLFSLAPLPPLPNGRSWANSEKE